jgi:hypothetical protein
VVGARRFSPRLAAVVLLAVGAVAAGGCQRDDSILLVEVAGDLALMPSQLSVTVWAGGRSRGLMVPRSPTTIYLPTSFTVELDRSITGPVTIAIDALDGNGYSVASGGTTQTHINSGGQTIVTVTISSGLQP